MFCAPPGEMRFLSPATTSARSMLGKAPLADFFPKSSSTWSRFMGSPPCEYPQFPEAQCHSATDRLHSVARDKFVTALNAPVVRAPGLDRLFNIGPGEIFRERPLRKFGCFCI